MRTLVLAETNLDVDRRMVPWRALPALLRSKLRAAVNVLLGKH